MWPGSDQERRRLDAHRSPDHASLRRLEIRGTMKTDSRVDLLRSMLRIRRVEETLADLYPAQEMRTPTHFSIGQEAVAVGVCAALRRDDIVYSGHRCHAHYLAKGGDLGSMVAELYGREI